MILYHRRFKFTINSQGINEFEGYCYYIANKDINDFTALKTVYDTEDQARDAAIDKINKYLKQREKKCRNQMKHQNQTKNQLLNQ